jgi:hypothetical protein
MEREMTNLKLAILTATLSLGLAAPAAQAAAAGFDEGITFRSAPSGLQDVRWVCGPYRCQWVPNYWRGHHHHRYHHHRRWRDW